MTRDLKHRVPGYQGKKSAETPAWLVGVVLIVATGFVVNAGLKTWKSRDINPEAPGQAVPTIQFSFFDTIPTEEQTLAENGISADGRARRLGKQAASGLFFIQAGAFAQKTDAMTLVNRLQSMTETQPRLETIERDSLTWYRVRLGPYQTLSDADTVRQFLRKNRIDSILQTPTQ